MIEKTLISKSIDHKKVLISGISYITYNAAKHKCKVDILNESKKQLEWCLGKYKELLRMSSLIALIRRIVWNEFSGNTKEPLFEMNSMINPRKANLKKLFVSYPRAR